MLGFEVESVQSTTYEAHADVLAINMISIDKSLLTVMLLSAATAWQRSMPRTLPRTQFARFLNNTIHGMD